MLHIEFGVLLSSVCLLNGGGGGGIIDLTFSRLPMHIPFSCLALIFHRLHRTDLYRFIQLAIFSDYKNFIILLVVYTYQYIETFVSDGEALQSVSTMSHIKIRDWSLMMGRGATKWENRGSETLSAPPFRRSKTSLAKLSNINVLLFVFFVCVCVCVCVCVFLSKYMKS